MLLREFDLERQNGVQVLSLEHSEINHLPHLLLQVQHIALVLLDQLDEVLQWQSIFKLQSGRSVVCSLGHVSLLDNVGRFGPQQFDRRLVVCYAVGDVD